MTYFVLAIVVGVAGFAWCWYWPDERDRFAHTVYGWIALILAAVGLNVVKFLYPGLW